MARRWALIALAVGALTCGPPPVDLGTNVLVPAIILTQLDNMLHLRVFPVGSFRCNTTSGQVEHADGSRATDIPGGIVNPSIRCSGTPTSVAMPVDTCFSKASSPTTMASVPAGSYVVLVEGSGNVTGAGGTMRNILLGSGCATVMASAGSSQTVNINMIQQADLGVCGNGMLESNEACDPPTPAGTMPVVCDNLCQFTEQTADIDTNPPHNPSLAWQDGGQLLVGFDDVSHPYVHMFDLNGQVINSPAVLFADNLVPMTQRVEQHFVRFSVTPTTYAAAWSTASRTGMQFDVGASIYTSYTTPTPPAPDVYVNPTSQMLSTTAARPAVALGSNRLVFLFADNTTSTLRISSTGTSAPITVPTSDDPFVTGAAAMNAQQPSIAPTSSGFVAVWTAGAVGNLDVYGVALNTSGMLVGAPAILTVQTGNNQDQPALAVRNNDVVVAWRDDSHADPADTDGTTVRWRHFNTSLMPSTMDIVAPTTTAGDQTVPTVAISSANTVFVAWENVADGTIRGRMFGTDGSTAVNRVNATPSDFVVNAGAQEMPHGMGPRHNPSIAFGGAMLFAVGWEDESTRHIMFRTFLAN